MFEKMWHMTLVLASTFPYPTFESGAVALRARMMRPGSRIVTWDSRRPGGAAEQLSLRAVVRSRGATGWPHLVRRFPVVTAARQNRIASYTASFSAREPK